MTLKLQFVRLRDHPILRITDDLCWWPPIWTSELRGAEKKLRGELGTLVGVIHRPNWPTFIFLRMTHEGESFHGALHVSNEGICLQIHILLNRNVGKTIKQIGDLEVAFRPGAMQK